MTNHHNLLAMQGFAELLEVYLRNSPYKSLRSFAKAAGCSASTVHACLRGTRAPPLKTLPKWAKALRLSPEQTRHFTFAAYRTKGWSFQKARPYITMAEEVISKANGELRDAETDLQEANRQYAERSAELAWSIKRIAQLEATISDLGRPLPPPPPHPMPPLTPAPPSASVADSGSDGRASS